MKNLFTLGLLFGAAMTENVPLTKKPLSMANVLRQKAML
jgi:hypothetical protein